MVENTKIKLCQNKGKTAEKVNKNFQNIFEKNRGLQFMFVILYLNGSNLDENLHSILIPGEIVKFKNAKNYVM